MYSRIEMITPEMAAKYLEKNMIHNRKPIASTVHKYADDMKAGRWELTSQGITFNERGDLVDGQHRLAAIIEANAPIQMNVTYDEKNDVSIHDRGRGRTLSNVLEMRGAPKILSNYTVIGAARLLLRLVGCLRPSDNKVCDFIQANEELFANSYNVCCEGVTKACMFSKKSVVVATVFCALSSGVPIESIKNFCNVLNSGYQESKEDSAAMVLRNYYSNLLTEKFTSTGGSAVSSRTLAITACALHDYCNRIPRTKLWTAKQAPYYIDATKEKILKHYVA